MKNFEIRLDWSSLKMVTSIIEDIFENKKKILNRVTKNKLHTKNWLLGWVCHKLIKYLPKETDTFYLQVHLKNQKFFQIINNKNPKFEKNWRKIQKIHS